MTAPETLRQEFEKRISIGDFRGIGNRIVEILVEEHQRLQPDARATFVSRNATLLIASCFDIPPGLSYANPLRDEYVEFKNRNSWCEFHYPYCFIVAFVLGATIRQLPEPHAQLTGFYDLMAQRQEQCIRVAKAEYQNRSFDREAEEVEFMISELLQKREQLSSCEHLAEHVRAAEIAEIDRLIRQLSGRSVKTQLI